MSILPRNMSAGELLDWCDRKRATVSFRKRTVVLRAGRRTISRPTLADAVEAYVMNELVADMKKKGMLK